MQKMIKALKDAQAVLADYIVPRMPQPGLSLYQETCLKLEDSEKVINKLLGILDNRELVEEQRRYTVGENGDVVCGPPVLPTVKPSSLASADPNVEAVRKMLLDRSALGFKKYGVGTNRDDLQLADWLQHMQEELCDAVVYIEAAKTGPNPHATELKEARKERERALKALQDAAERDKAHQATARLLRDERCKNAQLTERLQRITDALNGAK